MVPPVTTFREAFTSGLRAALSWPAGSSTETAPYAPLGLASPWADSTHLATITLANLFTDDPARLPLTREQCMAIPAVARARNLIAPLLGRIPLAAHDQAGTEVPSSFLLQPDPSQSRFLQVTWTIDDLIFHGVSWWYVTDRAAASNGGRPLHARRILPGGVTWEDGGRVRVYGRLVAPADVLRIDGPHEGLIHYGGTSLRMAAQLEVSASRFAENPVPSVELHQTDDAPMSPADRQSLIAGWVAARKDPARAGVAFTTRNVEVKTHGAPAENLLTEGRNAAAVDTARLVGVPADAVDAAAPGGSMTYANAETKLRVLIDYGAAAYAAALIARLSMDDVMPRGQSAHFRGLDLEHVDTDPTPGADSSPAAAPSSSTAPAPGVVTDQQPTEVQQ